MDLALHAGDGVDVLAGLLLDDVHHVVDGDAPREPAVLVHYGNGDQVVFLQHPGDLVLRHFHRHRDHRPFHDVGDGFVRARQHEIAEGQDAGDVPLHVHHEDVVDLGHVVLGPPDQADGLLHGGVLRHRHVLRLHDAAGSVRRMIQQVANLLRQLQRHLRQDGGGAFLRQGLEQVGGIVGVEFLHQPGQLAVREVRHQLVAHRR